jgi:hypothetical protein
MGSPLRYMHFNLGVIKGGKNACGEIEIKITFCINQITINFLSGCSLWTRILLYATLFPITNQLYNQEFLVPLIDNCGT